MLALNAKVFDEFITGTTTTWYSADALNATLGDVDRLELLALATNVRGAPSLSVYVDSSNDGRSWVLSTVANGDLFISPIGEGAMGQFNGGQAQSFLRLRVLLTGTTPGLGCRLTINGTGRNAD